MPEEWLIDGFNLLYRLKNRQLSALFGLVADFAAARRCLALVVLDGKGNDEECAAFQTPSFQIRYSKEVSADAVIERRLCEKKGLAAFVVVTGDRAITQMARGSGARVIGADEFISLLNQTRKENSELLFKRSIESHGFHRPFEGKI
ncbi:MAG: NYN domain-containing protein [Candidatus Omnitrophica bacterium]|nr:NYN domain-containing protein [Candidatus Omnitrophota bacterium]